MPSSMRPHGRKAKSATVKPAADSARATSVGGAHRNASINEDVESMRATLKVFETSALRADEDLHAFLASVYVAYVSARDNKAVDELIATCCPDKMKGATKRTHDVAKILKGLLGEKGQDKERRQTIHEWKNCICGMLAHDVDKHDAEEMLSTHSVSFWVEQYKLSTKSDAPIEAKKRSSDGLKPRIEIADEVAEKIKEVMATGGKIKAMIDVHADGTFLITDVRAAKD